MNKIFNPNLEGAITKVLILLFIAKAISLGILWYAPADGVELSTKNNYQPDYQRVDFSNMITRAKIIQNKPIVQKVNTGISMTNMILKGLYGTKTKGFIVVALKSKPKETKVVAIGEVYQGYKLKSILINEVIFEKDNKEYFLSLGLVNKKNDARIEKMITKVKAKNTTASFAPKIVTRKDIAHYAKNPNEIWQNISIVEIRNGQNIDGFRVTRINKRSVFAQLGLKKGDIIIKANNIELKSYRDALAIYEKIDKIKSVQLVVIRNNQEVELVYDIN